MDLKEREQEILKIMAQGGNTRQEAERIFNENQGRSEKAVSAIQEIKKKLEKEKVVTYKGIEFTIRPIPVFLFFGNDEKKWDDFHEKSPEALEKLFVDYAKSKPITEVLRPVLLAGVKFPALENKPPRECSDGELSVETLLTDVTTAALLFRDISKFTAEFNIG